MSYYILHCIYLICRYEIVFHGREMKQKAGYRDEDERFNVDDTLS